MQIHPWLPIINGIPKEDEEIKMVEKSEKNKHQEDNAEDEEKDTAEEDKGKEEQNKNAEEMEEEETIF